MKNTTLTFALLSLTAASDTFALDPGCLSITQASALKVAQPAWQTITHSAHGTMEIIKANGSFYLKPADNTWQRTVNLDHSEQVWRENILQDRLKVVSCRTERGPMLSGQPTRMTSYQINMQGFTPSPANLFVGVDDGLPYKLIYQGATTLYSYDKVTAPTTP